MKSVVGWKYLCIWERHLDKYPIFNKNISILLKNSTAHVLIRRIKERYGCIKEWSNRKNIWPTKLFIIHHHAAQYTLWLFPPLIRQASSDQTRKNIPDSEIQILILFFSILLGSKPTILYLWKLFALGVLWSSVQMILMN